VRFQVDDAAAIQWVVLAHYLQQKRRVALKWFLLSVLSLCCSGGCGFLFDDSTAKAASGNCPAESESPFHTLLLHATWMIPARRKHSKKFTASAKNCFCGSFYDRN
jgi:hypothetical protein